MFSSPFSFFSFVHFFVILSFFLLCLFPRPSPLFSPLLFFFPPTLTLVKGANNLSTQVATTGACWCSTIHAPRDTTLHNATTKKKRNASEARSENQKKGQKKEGKTSKQGKKTQKTKIKRRHPTKTENGESKKKNMAKKKEKKTKCCTCPSPARPSQSFSGRSETTIQ